MKRHLIAVLILVSATFLSYSNSLNGTWAMDDVLAHEPATVSDIDDLLGFRKVTYFSFFLNNLIAPFRPFHFRLVNLLIHIINSLLVYSVACKTLSLKVMGDSASPFPLHRDEASDSNLQDLAFFTALLSAIIFALHPLNINAVAYIIQRMTSLSATFVLLSLLIYIRARRSTAKPLSALLFLMSAVLVIIGIFSKENAVLAIPLVLLYDYLFLSRSQTGRFLNVLAIVSASGVVIFGFASYFLNLNTVLSDLSQFFLNPHQPLSGKGWMAVDVSWTPLEHVLTEFRVLTRYLFLFFVPLPRLLVFVWWNYPISHSIIDPVATLFSMIFVASLIIFSILKIRRYPLLCFGILWYFIAISLESFFSLGSDLYFEHRNYLPLAGFIIGLTGQTVTTLKKYISEKRAWILIVIITTVLGSLTFARNTVWKDTQALWEDTVKKNPADYRARNNLGLAYQSRGLTDKAVEQFLITTKLKPRYSKAHNNLGVAYNSQGLTDKAVEHYKIATFLKPDYLSPHINLGNIYLSQGLTGRAIESYSTALKLDPLNPVVHNNLGVAYKSQGLLEKAVEHYSTSINLKPDYSEAYNNLGNAFISLRNTDRAIESYMMALQTDPYNTSAHINLGIAYSDHGFIEKAKHHFNIADALRTKMMTTGRR